MITGVETGISHDPSEIQETQTSWTPQRAAEIFHHSWPHSQGQPELQKHLFGYAHRQLPGATISDEFKSDILKLSIKPIHDHVGQNPHAAAHDASVVVAHPVPKNIPQELIARLNDMQDVFNGEHPSHGTVDSLTKAMIRRDYRWLVGEFNLADDTRKAEPGRPRSNPDVTDPKRDPWLSHIIHYGMLGHPTGHPLFDQMYQEINEYIRHGNASAYWSRETDAEFDSVLRVYAEKHPHVQSIW